MGKLLPGEGLASARGGRLFLTGPDKGGAFIRKRHERKSGHDGASELLSCGAVVALLRYFMRHWPREPYEKRVWRSAKYDLTIIIFMACETWTTGLAINSRSRRPCPRELRASLR